MFNPEEFMQTQVQDEFETKRSLIPEGEYLVRIDSIEAKTVGAANRPVLSLTLALTNTGDGDLDERRLWHTIWLDIDERGALMSGSNKNIGLGQLLTALDLNGKPWSPAELNGQVVMIQVAHGLNKSSGELEEKIRRLVKAA